MKGRWILYSAEEMAWLEERKTWVISELHQAFQAEFDRQDVTAANLHSLRKRKGWKTGRSGHFQKGSVPLNRGKKMPYNANSAATRFKKGERRGIAVRLYKPVGTLRTSRDGYVEIKIHDGMPLQSRWRALHLVRWEEINGPIPKGMVLKCLDGDRQNTDPANWEAIPRSMLPRLAGGNLYTRFVEYDSAPAELKPVLLSTAKLAHRARDLARRANA